MKMCEVFRSVFISFLCSIFTLQTTLVPIPTAHALAPVPAVALSSFPKNLATVVSAQFIQAPAVIHIQDAHAHPEVQKKIVGGATFLSITKTQLKLALPLRPKKLRTFLPKTILVSRFTPILFVKELTTAILHHIK